MPRIRTIKPELWQDEKVARLDPLTRLVFIGLIGMADDAGRLVDNIKSIDGFIFPETEDTSQDAIVTLSGLSRILRYVAPNGQRVIQIVNWDRHQKVDHPSKHLLPAPRHQALAAAKAAASVGALESLAEQSRDVLATTSTSTSTPTSTPTNAGSSAKNPASRVENSIDRENHQSPGTALTIIAGYVRNHWWSPDEEPPADWTMDRELSIWKAELRAGLNLEDGVKAIQGLRLLADSGKIDWLQPCGKLTGRALFLSHHGPIRIFPEALDAYYAEGNQPRRNGSTTGTTSIGDVLRNYAS